MYEQIKVVSSIPLPDVPRGRIVTVERTPRIDGLIASGRLTVIPMPPVYTVDDVPSTMAEVKGWVSEGADYNDRARRSRVALEAERQRPGTPRTTLESWLTGTDAPETPHVRAHDDDGSSDTHATADDFAEHTGDLSEPD